MRPWESVRRPNSSPGQVHERPLRFFQPKGVYPARWSMRPWESVRRPSHESGRSPRVASTIRGKGFGGPSVNASLMSEVASRAALNFRVADRCAGASPARLRAAIGGHRSNPSLMSEVASRAALNFRVADPRPVLVWHDCERRLADRSMGYSVFLSSTIWPSTARRSTGRSMLWTASSRSGWKASARATATPGKRASRAAKRSEGVRRNADPKSRRLTKAHARITPRSKIQGTA
jgi:hypothetical protein